MPLSDSRVSRDRQANSTVQWPWKQEAACSQIRGLGSEVWEEKTQESRTGSTLAPGSGIPSPGATRLTVS